MKMLTVRQLEFRDAIPHDDVDAGVGIGEGLVEALQIDVVALETRPGVVVVVGCIDAAQKVLRQPALDGGLAGRRAHGRRRRLRTD